MGLPQFHTFLLPDLFKACPRPLLKHSPVEARVLG
jgi:hypothetical protein